MMGLEICSHSNIKYWLVFDYLLCLRLEGNSNHVSLIGCHSISQQGIPLTTIKTHVRFSSHFLTNMGFYLAPNRRRYLCIINLLIHSRVCCIINFNMEVKSFSGIYNVWTMCFTIFPFSDSSNSFFNLEPL